MGAGACVHAHVCAFDSDCVDFSDLRHHPKPIIPPLDPSALPVASCICFFWHLPNGNPSTCPTIALSLTVIPFPLSLPVAFRTQPSLYPPLPPLPYLCPFLPPLPCTLPRRQETGPLLCRVERSIRRLWGGGGGLWQGADELNRSQQWGRRPKLSLAGANLILGMYGLIWI